MTPTPEELRGAEAAVAAALGHVVMEAGNLEYEVRVLGMYVAGDGTPLYQRLRSGSRQGSKLVEIVRDAARAALVPDLFTPIALALDEVVGVFELRNDLVHSAWTASVFQSSPEPFRLSMRRLQSAGEQSHAAEIHRLQARITQARRQLTHAFQAAWFAEFSDDAASLRAGAEALDAVQPITTPKDSDPPLPESP